LVFTKYAYNRFECEPFRDVLSSSEHLAEFGSRKLLDLKSISLCLLISYVSLLFSVYKVERRNRGYSELLRHLVSNILCVVSTIVILSGDGGLGSSHITSYNEMCASEILTDHHVLNSFTGSSHVHGVRKVFPEGTGVLGLFLQYNISLVTNISRDIVCLGRSASRVYKYNSALSYTLVIKSTGEELIMSTVHRVTALECNNILIVRKSCTNLSRGLAREITNWSVKPSYLSSHVVFTTLGSNHKSSRVLNFGSSITLEALNGLVRDELVGELNSCNRGVSILKKNSHTRLKILRVSIEYNRKSEDKSVFKLHLLNNRFVSCLVHESSKRGESSVHDELNVTKLTRSKLDLSSTRSDSSALCVLILYHEVNELSSVRNLLSHLKSSVEPGSNSSLRNSNTIESTRSASGESRCSSDEGKCSDSKLHC